jgi:DNA invertase Pin-like site-specific DNA recombinase
MKYGYARISSIDQNPDMQLKALQRAGCKKIFTDRRTGATTKRLALTRCVKSGPPPKLDRQQIDHARRLIDQEGKRREDVADLFKVSRSTLYRALAASA